MDDDSKEEAAQEAADNDATTYPPQTETKGAKRNLIERLEDEGDDDE
jgi:hypothetical protein